MDTKQDDLHKIFETVVHGGTISVGMDALANLQNLAISNEIRDFPWASVVQGIPISIYDVIFAAFKALFEAIQKPETIRDDQYNRTYEIKLWDVWNSVCILPETDHIVASSNQYITIEFCEALCKYIQLSVSTVRVVPSSSDNRSIKPFSYYMQNRILLLHWLYTHRINFRPKLRQLIYDLITYKAEAYSNFEGGDRYRHIPELLKLLNSLIEGFVVPLSQENKSLLSTILIPLHMPNEMVEWRDQIPIIDSYHSILVSCCTKMIEKDRVSYQALDTMTEDSTGPVDVRSSAFVLCFQGVLSAWPNPREANTSKEILLLQELETLLKSANASEYQLVKDLWLDRWLYCLTKDSVNIRTKQRALQIFRNPKILSLCLNIESNVDVRSNDPKLPSNKFLQLIIPALFNHGELSWNPTVNKMSALALQKLQNLDESLFFQHVDDYLLQNISIPDPNTRDGFPVPRGPLKSSTMPPKSRIFTPPPISGAPSKPILPVNTTLTSTQLSSDVFGASGRPLKSMQAMSGWKPSHGSPPPVTVTGVAPWAKLGEGQNDASHYRDSNQIPIKNIENGSRDSTMTSFSIASNTETSANPTISNAREALLSYIARCLPPSEEALLQSSVDWNAQQAAAVPTLLPTLKFHDLVFGKELGSGAFSIVKYARLINKDKPRSLWPEYAVKITSESSLQEHSYHAAVIREMATLQLFSHPGIARLISAFRYNRSSYMVLEYAAGGDLHSHVLSSGRLAHRYTRYVIGEVAAALSYTHDQGFAFNDLKPENVLITAIGHIKITDFGAARPITDESKAAVINSRRSLGVLRDGDWRQHVKISSESELDHNKSDSKSHGQANDSEDSWLTDERLEGTPAYCPLEVLTKTSPLNQLSDSWALGCLTLFCLEGRPRFFGDIDEVINQIRRDFQLVHTSDIVMSQDNKVTFTENGSGIWSDLSSLKNDDAISRRAISFLKSLLAIDPKDRISVQGALSHDYLTTGPIHTAKNEAPDKSVSGMEISDDSDANVRVSPQELHFKEPLCLPKGEAQVIQEEDQLWARRQFSILWAPMASDVKNDSNDISKRLRTSNQYVMVPIQETDLEQHVTFSSSYI